MNDSVMDAAIQARAAGVRGKTEVSELNLERLYDQYASALYRFALALLGSRDDAEDVVQEVFARLARDARKVERVANLKCYLFTAARNAAYGILRSKRRRDVLTEAVTSEMLAAPESAAVGLPMERQALVEAFAGLPVDQREVLVLKIFEEMTFAEVGQTLRISANTAASRYRYGIAKLKQALEAMDDG